MTETPEFEPGDVVRPRDQPSKEQGIVVVIDSNGGIHVRWEVSGMEIWLRKIYCSSPRGPHNARAQRRAAWRAGERKVRDARSVR